MVLQHRKKSTTRCIRCAANHRRHRTGSAALRLFGLYHSQRQRYKQHGSSRCRSHRRGSRNSKNSYRSNSRNSISMESRALHRLHPRWATLLLMRTQVKTRSLPRTQYSRLQCCLSHSAAVLHTRSRQGTAAHGAPIRPQLHTIQCIQQIQHWSPRMGLARPGWTACCATLLMRSPSSPTSIAHAPLLTRARSNSVSIRVRSPARLESAKTAVTPHCSSLSRLVHPRPRCPVRQQLYLQPRQVSPAKSGMPWVPLSHVQHRHQAASYRPSLLPRDSESRRVAHSLLLAVPTRRACRCCLPMVRSCGSNRQPL